MKSTLMILDKASKKISDESMLSYRQTRSPTRRPPDLVKTCSVLDRNGLETNSKSMPPKKSKFSIDFNPKWDMSILEKYTYRSIDHSLISRYILRYYWDYVASLFPVWVAPNLITLLGFSFVILNFCLVLYWIPDLARPAPSWIYMV
jgi:hypothetical protein